MPTTPSFRSPLAVLAGLILLGCGLTSRGRDAGGQPAQPLNQPKAGPTPGIYLASHCKSCHDQERSRDYSKSLLDRTICRMNEWQYYDQKDKHQIAFRTLQSPRSQAMVEQLGHRDRKATAVGACVACHAVGLPEIVQLEPEALAEGVTCVACHGPYADWVRIHPESILLVGRAGGNQARAGRIDWTDLTRKDKERQFGMTDLWDPVRRAETCASCHVGHFAQGKVVTHAMYAAGHPPLPGFETATFGDEEPRHWQYLREKTPERLSRLKLPDPHNLEQTQLVAVSGLVVLREWMTLFADQASASKPNPVEAPWPDFARFDCYACHHELQAKDGVSWRQVRSRNGHPGRPTAPEWPLILVQLGIQAANPRQAAMHETQFKQHLAEFHESMKVRPFGDPERVIPAARKTAAWADSLLKSLNQTTFDAAQAHQMLEKLCEMARESIPDYDSARQLAWAFRVIYRESTSKEKRDPVILHVLDDLEAALALNLSSAAGQVPIEKTLQDRLNRIADFDPGSFQAHFEMIAERLAPPAAIPKRRRS